MAHFFFWYTTKLALTTESLFKPLGLQLHYITTTTALKVNMSTFTVELRGLKLLQILCQKGNERNPCVWVGFLLTVVCWKLCVWQLCVSSSPLSTRPHHIHFRIPTGVPPSATRWMTGLQRRGTGTCPPHQSAAACRRTTLLELIPNHQRDG